MQGRCLKSLFKEILVISGFCLETSNFFNTLFNLQSLLSIVYQKENKQ